MGVGVCLKSCFRTNLPQHTRVSSLHETQAATARLCESGGPMDPIRYGRAPLASRTTAGAIKLQAAFAINFLGLCAAARVRAWAPRESPHIHGTARGRRLSLTDSHTRSCMSIQHTSTAELANIQVHKNLLKKR